mgnify:FL=1
MVNGQQKERLTIIQHSGDYGRAAYALSIALASLASGLGAHILLTYEGLRRFTKGYLVDVGEETLSGVRAYLQRGLVFAGIVSLDTQLVDARKLGLKLYAWPNAMAVFHILLWTTCWATLMILWG